MARFWDNVSGWQKILLFVLIVATAVLFPEAYARVFESIMAGLRAFADLLTGGVE
ncbi:MAG: hypothetical protein KAJ42_10135 [Gemmatimonadetes bacterium]|nr:hypothetical protein [Gemmatimonadota bacterium]